MGFLLFRFRKPRSLGLQAACLMLGVAGSAVFFGSCRTRNPFERDAKLESKGFADKPLSLEETLRYLPLRSRTQFAPSARKWMRADTMWRVPYARVLIADYDLLRKDFSVLKDRSESEIRQWLVEQTGFVSDLQTHPIHNAPNLPGTTGTPNPYHVNSLIPVREPANWQKFHGAWLAEVKNQKTASRDELRKTALASRPRCVPQRGVVPERCSMRPPTYERAVVLPVYWDRSQVGLIDIKGVGVSDAKFPAEAADHATGLLPTGEALREYFLSKLVGWIFERTVMFPKDALKVQTLGHYAVLDLGFADHWRDENGVSTYKPVGLLLRQAHNRDDYYSTMVAPTAFTDDEGNVDFEDLVEDEGLKSLPKDYARELFPVDMQMRIAKTLFAAGVTTDTGATSKPGADVIDASADVQFALNRLPDADTGKERTVVSLVDFGSFGFVSYHDLKVKEKLGLEQIFNNDFSLKNTVYGWGAKTQWRPDVVWYLPDGSPVDLSDTKPDANYDSLGKVAYKLADFFKVPVDGYPNPEAWKAAESRAHDHLRDIFVAYEKTIQGQLKSSWVWPDSKR